MWKSKFQLINFIQGVIVLSRQWKNMLYNPMLFEHQYKNKLSRPMNVTFAVPQSEEVSPFVVLIKFVLSLLTTHHKHRSKCIHRI